LAPPRRREVALLRVMKVGGNMYGLTQSADEQVRLRACQWWTARRMGWKETNVNEQVGKDGGPIETKDVSAIDIIRTRIAAMDSSRPADSLEL
jgi:hypothetical protein